jgi:hypothetical protein
MLEVKDRKQVLLGARKKRTHPISVTLTQEAKEMIEESLRGRALPLCRSRDGHTEIA